MEPKDKEPKREYDDSFTPEETQELLVHLLRSPAVAAAAGNQLKESHFADEGRHYRYVWSVAQGLIRKHGAEIVASSQFLDRLADKLRALFSGEVLLSEFITEDQIQAIDDLIAIAEKRSAQTIDPDYGIELLKRFLIQRDLQVEVCQLAELFKVSPLLSLPESLQRLAETGAAIKSLSIVTHDTIGSEWDAHEERLARFRGRELVGLKTGIKSLDERTLGLRGFGALGAGAGVGKTALALNIGIGVCRHHAVNDAAVVFVSLEMPRHELYSRVKCNLADMEWSTLVRGSKGLPPGSGNFSAADAAKLQQAQRRLSEEQIGTRLTILDREQLRDMITADRLAMFLRRAKEKAGASRALLIVDYVQILPVPAEVSRFTDLEQDRYRVRVLQDVIRKSKSADHPEGDTVLFISETRKPTKSKDPWANGLAELMGSARLGYAVDYALLYRRMTSEEISSHYQARAKDDLQEKGIAPIMLSLEKGRDGMTRGSWPMEFHFWKSIFAEIDPVPPERCALVLPPGDPDENESDEDDAELATLGNFDALYEAAFDNGTANALRRYPPGHEREVGAVDPQRRKRRRRRPT